MIINLYMEMEDPQGMRINYKFLNEKTNEVVATATNNFGSLSSSVGEQ